jgi:hypothetical protein
VTLVLFVHPVELDDFSFVELLHLNEVVFVPLGFLKFGLKAFDLIE